MMSLTDMMHTCRACGKNFENKNGDCIDICKTCLMTLSDDQTNAICMGATLHKCRHCDTTMKLNVASSGDCDLDGTWICSKCTMRYDVREFDDDAEAYIAANKNKRVNNDNYKLRYPNGWK